NTNDIIKKIEERTGIVVEKSKFNLSYSPENIKYLSKLITDSYDKSGTYLNTIDQELFNKINEYDQIRQTEIYTNEMYNTMLLASAKKQGFDKIPDREADPESWKKTLRGLNSTADEFNFHLKPFYRKIGVKDSKKFIKENIGDSRLPNVINIDGNPKNISKDVDWSKTIITSPYSVSDPGFEAELYDKDGNLRYKGILPFSSADMMSIAQGHAGDELINLVNNQNIKADDLLKSTQSVLVKNALSNKQSIFNIGHFNSNAPVNAPLQYSMAINSVGNLQFNIGIRGETYGLVLPSIDQLNTTLTALYTNMYNDLLKSNKYKNKNELSKAAYEQFIGGIKQISKKIN
ncbi:MAG: hypothetical protein KC414_13980, partial [Romboutsia sp.]|nr:hypothetical protein [Romboutsia sp.]